MCERLAFLAGGSEFLHAISSTDRAEDHSGFLIVSALQVNSYPYSGLL